MQFVRLIAVAAAGLAWTVAAAAPPAPAPATRPAAPPASRPVAAAPGTRPVAPVSTRPAAPAAGPVRPATSPAAGPAASPAAGVRPKPRGDVDDLPPLPQLPPGLIEPSTRPTTPRVTVKAINTPWFAAARLRVEGMRAAADEVPLAGDVRGQVAARVIRARAAVDAAAAGPDAGAAAKTVDDVLAKLQAEVNDVVGDQATRYNAKAAQIMAEARDLGKLESSGTRTLLEVLVLPTPQQRKLFDKARTENVPLTPDLQALAERTGRVDRVLADNRSQIEQLMFSGQKDGAELRRFDIGLATRAALRSVVSPKQLKDWDEVSAPAARPAGAGAAAAAATRPTTRSTADAAEITASYVTQFDVMRAAAQEGPYPAAPKAALVKRIDEAKAAVAAVAAEPVDPAVLLKSAEPPTAPKVAAIRKDLEIAAIDILGGLSSNDFDWRVQQIDYQLIALQDPKVPLDHLWVRDPGHQLELTADQASKIDQVLTDRIAKLQAVDRDAKPDDGLLVLQMRRNQVALATRAAIRALLTKDQLKKWDLRPTGVGSGGRR